MFYSICLINFGYHLQVEVYEERKNVSFCSKHKHKHKVVTKLQQSFTLCESTIALRDSTIAPRDSTIAARDSLKFLKPFEML